MSELEKKTLAELKTMAKEMDIPSVSGLKKSELIEKIEEKQLSMEQTVTETASGFSQTKSDEILQENTEKEKQVYEETGEGILEVLPDGYGFLRAENCLPGINDVYVSPAQIRRFNLRTGDRGKGHYPSAQRRGKGWWTDLCADSQWGCSFPCHPQTQFRRSDTHLS